MKSQCKNPNHKTHVANFVKKYRAKNKGRGKGVPNTIILVDPKDWSVDLEHPDKNTTECCRGCSMAEDIALAMKGIGTTYLGICACQWKTRY